MTRYHERLRHNILFETISDAAFKTVAGNMEEKHFQAGDIILEDNANGNELFLLVEGRVSIIKQTKTGELKMLALLHAGDFFGELELIDGRARSARVTAFDNCTVYTLNKFVFDDLLTKNHPFALRVMQVLSLRLRATNNHFISELEKHTQQWKQEVEKLEKLIEATKNVNSTLDLDKLLKIILDTALNIVDGDRGTLYLVEEDRNELWSKLFVGKERVTIKLPIGKGIAGYVAATGDTLNIEDAYVDPRFNPDVDKKTGYRTKTILCMPLKNKAGKIVGVLQLLNKRKGGFTQEDEQFLRALSIHAAIAIENARLYESEKAYQQMREEVRLAAKIQLDLLPKSNPKIFGYDIAAISIPAKEVGGDYYDFINLDNTHIGICLGDVSGKGLPASLLMANLQATLRGQSFGECSPKKCLNRSNSLLYRSTSSDKFVTLFYSMLDTDQNRLVYSNAGHENPILLRSKDKTIRLNKGGVVLGIMDNFPYEEEEVEIQHGDFLTIYSDGISEAMNSKDEMFGEERLEKILSAYKNEPAEKIIESVVDAVKKFAGGRAQSDDITILIIKRN
ncbi:MAG: SpoIIE family protein phosphatase [Ignavibacteriales bacterium]|nr:SpoIIE family protein phosphatase [Ignavibacteriales bacterium]